MEKNIEKRRKKACFKPCRATKSMFLILGVMIFILCLPSINAAEFDNVKKFKDVGKYGKIDVENWFGIGGKLAEYNLIENTDVCDLECYARGNVTFHTESKLFSDIEFYDKKNRKTSNL